jgi:hypothetical protein
MAFCIKRSMLSPALVVYTMAVGASVAASLAQLPQVMQHSSNART